MPVTCECHQIEAALSEGPLHLPYWSLRASQPGPTLLVVAAQHGNEVQGCEVIRRFRDRALTDLRCGRLLLCPFLNLPAVRNRRPHQSSGPETPYGVDGGRNINRTWPGDAAGGDPARLTAAVAPGLVDAADAVIDIHCWPASRGSTTLADAGMTDWARCAALRFVRVAASKPAPTAGEGVTLVRHVRASGRPALCLELSGQYAVNEREVIRGLRAVVNLARRLGCFAGEPQGVDEDIAWLPQDTLATLRAPAAGLFSGTGLTTSTRVEAGDLLGTVLGVDNLEVAEIRAPQAGYLWTYGRHVAHVDVSLAAQHPLVDAGDIIVEIAQAGPGPGMNAVLTVR